MIWHTGKHCWRRVTVQEAERSDYVHPHVSVSVPERTRLAESRTISALSVDMLCGRLSFGSDSSSASHRSQSVPAVPDGGLSL